MFWYKAEEALKYIAVHHIIKAGLFGFWIQRGIYQEAKGTSLAAPSTEFLCKKASSTQSCQYVPSMPASEWPQRPEYLSAWWCSHCIRGEEGLQGEMCVVVPRLRFLWT